MSKSPKKFTAEEKTSIALKAVAGGEDAIKKLAEEHHVTPEEIRSWIRDFGVSDVNETENDVSLEASDGFIKSVEYGAAYDKLNYPRLTFWSVFGTGVILIMIVSIMYIYDYTTTSTTQQASDRSEYYEIQRIQQNTQAKLGSFGVVDPDEGIYRIPIDSAISIIATDPE